MQDSSVTGRASVIRILRSAALLLTLALGVENARSDELFDPLSDPADRVISLPYAFWNESFGTAVGYVHAVNGFLQPQARALGTLIAGSTGSAMGFFMGQNFRPFASERLFFDPIVSVGYFNDADAYVDGNPAFPGVRAGSNESDPEDRITGSGWDNFFRLRFRYLLDVGSGRDELIPRYTIKHGLPVGESLGGTGYNPLESGWTYLELRPFYRSQSLDVDGDEVEQQTNGVEFTLFWDNRDYPSSATRGNGLTLKVARDWELFDSSGSWTNIAMEYDHYLDLGASDGFRQRVLALNFWTAYSPTWEVQPDGTIEHRPPAFSGATLGGLFRMRAYPSQRFSDKAAIYYAAELRMIPEWNFFDGYPWLQRHLGVEWIQLVPFVEVGRVAPNWDAGTLHEEMKWDVGVGLRAWAKGLVVRVDVAGSEEDFGVQMMVGQPFQF